MLSIFYLFDQLNYRFYKLIRAILLHVDLQNVSKLVFKGFGQKMLSDSHIKHQVISLKLLNDQLVFRTSYGHPSILIA
jgi:hypothetical protein